jgi:hypothetical protein
MQRCGRICLWFESCLAWAFSLAACEGIQALPFSMLGRRRRPPSTTIVTAIANDVSGHQTVDRVRPTRGAQGMTRTAFRTFPVSESAIA